MINIVRTLKTFFLQFEDDSPKTAQTPEATNRPESDLYVDANELPKEEDQEFREKENEEKMEKEMKE